MLYPPWLSFLSQTIQLLLGGAIYSALPNLIFPRPKSDCQVARVLTLIGQVQWFIKTGHSQQHQARYISQLVESPVLSQEEELRITP